MPWSRGAKIATGAAAGAVVVGGAIYGISKLKAPVNTTTTSPGGSASGLGFSLGQPFGSQYARAFPPLLAARVSIRSLDAQGVFIGSVGGLFQPSALTLSPGATLSVPLSATNNLSVPLYVAAHGYTWEDTTPPSGSTTITIPNIGTFPVGGHLTAATGSGNPATGVLAANGGTWSPTLHSQGALAYTGIPAGILVHLHAFTDSAMTRELPGSPLAAWTPAFLTVGAPSISQAISFGLGNPS
jgi:hypothetical protein